VAEKLDPFQAYLPYKLFRDSTRTVNGKVVKVSLSLFAGVAPS
jgi:import inner membrane translocase subunit TIM50